MLNELLVIVLVIATVAGFAGMDHFFARTNRRDQVASGSLFERTLRLFSATSFIVVSLFFIPLALIASQLGFHAVAAFAASGTLALGLAFLIKYIFRRHRPFNHLTYLGKVDSSFPSAHAAGSFAVAFAFAAFWPSLAVIGFSLASVVAFSRIYLQFHFFSDVAAGILIAYLATTFVFESDFLTFLGF